MPISVVSVNSKWSNLPGTPAGFGVLVFLDSFIILFTRKQDARMPGCLKYTKDRIVQPLISKVLGI